MSLAPVAKKMRAAAPAVGYEVYSQDNPNTPAFIDFGRLKELTVLNYLDRYDVPVAPGATLAEKRVQASRHFHLISTADLAASAKTGAAAAAAAGGKQQQQQQQRQNSIDRFHGHLQKLKNARAKNLRLQQQGIPVTGLIKLGVKPPRLPAAAAVEAAAEAGVADVPAAMCNRDPSVGYCLLSCKFNGSHKSGGTMIACDGDSHKEQWFHLSCVGLDDEPTGKWFCFTCKSLQDKQHARSSKKSAADDKGSGGGGGSGAADTVDDDEDDGYPRPASKKLQRYVGYIKNALLSITKKSGGRATEATAKDITAVVGRLYADKLDTKVENDSRKTIAWKSNVAKVLRSTKTPFEKTRRNNLCYYRLAPGVRKTSSSSSSNDS